MTIFAWHSGHQALCLPRPDGQPGVFAIKASDLRQMGFTVDDAAMAAALPRFDVPTISTQASAADVALAASQAQARRQSGALMRTGRR